MLAVTKLQDKFAVIFKTHFWDDFASRQFERLKQWCGDVDLFIMVDETHGSVASIPWRNVISITEAIAESEGYLCHPPGDVFWCNTDYQLYHFIDRFPGYSHVFTLEYDCITTIDIPNVLKTMAADDVDFVGERTRPMGHVWFWADSTRPYDGGHGQPVGRLVCCAAFSRTFLQKLQAARRAHTRQARGDQVSNNETGQVVWPNNEAFVAMEIERVGAKELPLSFFADASRYDWSPPHLECEIVDPPSGSVIHPVLDGPRYLRSIVKLGWRVEDIFEPDSFLYSQTRRCTPHDVASTFLPYFVALKNWDLVDQLLPQTDSLPEGSASASRAAVNIALGKHATQSSISEWSRSPDVNLDARGAISGVLTGGYGFHTDTEDRPWWCVDLERTYLVREVVIYNRLEFRFRARSLAVAASSDLVNWETVHQLDGRGDFGGMDGFPLKIHFEPRVEARFIRIEIQERSCLHLDQVEIYL